MPAGLPLTALAAVTAFPSPQRGEGQGGGLMTDMAEREGFEPSVEFPPHMISSHAD
jgi:hypothetical protein